MTVETGAVCSGEYFIEPFNLSVSHSLDISLQEMALTKQ